MKILFHALLMFCALASAQALDERTKSDVQQSMRAYVSSIISAEGHFPVVHEGKVLKLRLYATEKYPDGFHAGVKNHGQLFTSCADFKDARGNEYDLDFLVSGRDGKYQVVQPIVHKVNGVKAKYDLAH